MAELRPTTIGLTALGAVAAIAISRLGGPGNRQPPGNRPDDGDGGNGDAPPFGPSCPDVPRAPSCPGGNQNREPVVKDGCIVGWRCLDPGIPDDDPDDGSDSNGDGSGNDGSGDDGSGDDGSNGASGCDIPCDTSPCQIAGGERVCPGNIDYTKVTFLRPRAYAAWNQWKLGLMSDCDWCHVAQETGVWQEKPDVV